MTKRHFHRKLNEALTQATVQPAPDGTTAVREIVNLMAETIANQKLDVRIDVRGKHVPASSVSPAEEPELVDASVIPDTFTDTIAYDDLPAGLEKLAEPAGQQLLTALANQLPKLGQKLTSSFKYRTDNPELLAEIEVTPTRMIVLPQGVTITVQLTVKDWLENDQVFRASKAF